MNNEKFHDKNTEELCGAMAKMICAEEDEHPASLKSPGHKEKELQNMFCWPEKMMKSMFSVASGLYQQRKFSDASKAFSVLTMMNPLHPQYWIGQGLATQFQKENPENDIEDALNAHYMAMMLDPNNPYPCVYHAECLIMLKQEKVAMVFLDMAKDRMPEGEHEALRTYIESLKKGRR